MMSTRLCLDKDQQKIAEQGNMCMTDYAQTDDSPQNIEIQLFISFSYRTLADNDDVFLLPYDLLFTSYTMVSVIQLRMLISRNVHFQFRRRTPFTNSPRTNRFVLDECIQSSWTKLRQKEGSRGYRFHL